MELSKELKILNLYEEIDLFEKLKSLLITPNYLVKEDSLQNHKCPKCNGNHIIKHGKRNDIQRYKCKDCSKVFSERTNSALYNTKIPVEKWLMYIPLMFNKISIRECSKILNISVKTSFFMRHKILGCLEVILKNRPMKNAKKVESIYFDTSYKGNHGKNTITINKLKKSNEGVYVRIYKDEDDNIVSSKIEKEKAELLDIKEIRGNSYKFRVWIKKFRGVATRYLNNYLNLFVYEENIYNYDATFKFNGLLEDMFKIRANITTIKLM